MSHLQARVEKVRASVAGIAPRDGIYATAARTTARMLVVIVRGGSQAHGGAARGIRRARSCA